MRRLAFWIATACACAPSTGPHPSADGSDGPGGDATEEPKELDGICKTSPAEPPIVILGQGQSDYLKLADREEVQVEEGPQGGHHVWFAVLVKNLLRSGSRTRLTGTVPDTGTTITPFEVIYTFDPAEGGYCKLFGLRFQLDLDGVDYVPLLGHELDVTATVTDRSGDVGQASGRVMLASTLR